MAAKKKVAGPLVGPVNAPAVLTAPESNKAIARAKTALAKKWSVTRADTVTDAVDLSWFLVAVGRSNEGRELVDHLADQLSPGPDAALWAAAANALALAAWLAGEAEDATRQTQLVTRLVAHPSVPRAPKEAFEKALSIVQKDLRSAEVETTAKFACQFFARGCARAAYFCQMDRAGAWEPGAVDVPALEESISEGIGGLRAYLSR